VSFVVSSVEHGIGRVLLNRPAALNAVNGPMFADIGRILDAWIGDDAVRAVTIRGAGRAFCAGGDVRYTVESVRSGDHRLIDQLYGEEYRIDALIHRYPKPFVAVIHGACMGGGMGLSMHAAYRLVAEDALLAMPETELGFFPDCGVMWVLARLPGAIGRYLALTGARLSAADACYAGLATHSIRTDRAAEVESLLAESTDAAAFRAGLVALAADLPESALATHRAQIDAAFGQPSLAGIVAALERDATPWAAITLALLRRMSPTSVDMTFELLERERTLSLERSLAIEYEVARRLAWTPEFAEGVRAVILDKDRKPRWNPARIEDVDHAAVIRFLDEAQSAAA
jgi:enoyl-CoA hydratase